VNEPAARHECRIGRCLEPTVVEGCPAGCRGRAGMPPTLWVARKRPWYALIVRPTRAPGSCPNVRS
jgi:hypothetical protein